MIVLRHLWLAREPSSLPLHTSDLFMRGGFLKARFLFVVDVAERSKKMRRDGKSMKRLSELIVLKALSSQSDGLNWSALLELCGLSESTLSSSLHSLEAGGLVQRVVHGQTRPPRVCYKLTEDGFDQLDAAGECEEVVLEGEPEFKAPDNLEGYFNEYFRLRGLAMDVERGGVSPKRLFLTFGLLPVPEFARASIPTKEGELYLKFLAEVYVGSVDPRALVELPVEKGVEVIKFFWRLCSPNAHSSPEEMLGFTFDYPKAFKDAFTPKFERVLVKTFPYAEGEKMLRKAVFARLKAISHPLRERRQLISKIYL